MNVLFVVAHPDDETLGITAADFVDLYIHHVAGDALLHKYHFSVHMSESVAFGSGRLDGNVFQKGFLLASHFSEKFLTKIRNLYRNYFVNLNE